MNSNKVIIVSAGGTGGHIIPALVLCEEFIKNGWQVRYIGNKDSLEERLVQERGISFYPIDVQKLYRNWTFQHLKFPIKLLKSVMTSYQLIKQINPRFIIGTGGFVCGPVGLAAILAKVPLYLQEQNSFPGITTRFLGRFARKVFLGYKAAKVFFSKDNTEYSGNPIQKEKLLSNETINYEQYGLNKDSLKLLIIGGSQGSLFINNMVLKNLDFILNQGFEVIWQTGKNHLETIKQQISDRKGVYAFDFTNEMYKLYNSSDIALCRAGALTLAELEVKKIPSILVPLPNAAGNHQLRNAREFQNKGYGIVLEQKLINDFEQIFNLCVENLNQKKDKFKSCIHMEAASYICHSISDSMESKGKWEEKC